MKKERMSQSYAEYIVEALEPYAPIMSTEHLPKRISPEIVQEAFHALTNPVDGYRKDQSDRITWYAILEPDQYRILVNESSPSSLAPFTQILFDAILAHVRATKKVLIPNDEFEKLVTRTNSDIASAEKKIQEDIETFILPKDGQGFLRAQLPDLLKRGWITSDQIADIEKLLQDSPINLLSLFHGYVNSILKVSELMKEEPTLKVKSLEMKAVCEVTGKRRNLISEGRIVELLSFLQAITRDCDGKCDTCQKHSPV